MLKKIITTVINTHVLKTIGHHVTVMVVIIAQNTMMIEKNKFQDINLVVMDGIHVEENQHKIQLP